MMKTINKIREITGQVSQKHVGAYAAQSALFFCAEYDPDYFAASCYHTIYSGDKSRCYDCSGKFVSGDKYAGFYGWHCK